MAKVLIYSFEKSVGTAIYVYRDSNDYTNITYVQKSIAFVPTPPPANNTPVGTPICSGTTKISYFSKTTAPYAYYQTQLNSEFCGYVPPACDIVITYLNTTDETGVGADDGTVQFYAGSSRPVTTYTITIGAFTYSNTTGFFAGLAPGDYMAFAEDAHGCITQRPFKIIQFDPDATRYKYRLQFNSIKDNIKYELKFLDQKHYYDNLLYPKDLEGTDQPIMYKVDNANEDKTEPLLLTTLTINLWNTGLFSVDEFALSDERTWKIELYKDDVLWFQGWLLPDQIQDLYADPNYAVQLVATDGVSSLKGNLFADQTLFQIDPNGYPAYQQLYGVYAWIYLVGCCLKQLDYDFGYTTLISSLQKNSAYDAELWVNIGTWGDILYDSDNTPVDTYTALSLLLRAFNLWITQVNGKFVIGTWNDLWYINNSIKAADYANAFYAFDGNFGAVYPTSYGQYPTLQPIGFDQPNKPINPTQSINYDNAYQIEEEDISFNILALLYDNPSFEIGSVQGDAPVGMEIAGDITAYANYDPLDPAFPNHGAFQGNWDLRIYGYNFDGNLSPYIKLSTPAIIDQTQKKINLSFKWRPSFSVIGDKNPIPSFAILFIEADSTIWTWDFDTDLGYAMWRTVGESPITFVKQFVDTNIIWNNFNLTTDKLPGSQVGTFNLYFFPVPIYNTGDPNYLSNDGGDYYVDIDDLEITQSDANPAYVNTVGEKHIVHNLTAYTKAEPKTIESSLFTYPPNKRVAGNVFDFTTYELGNVINAWDYALNTNDTPDRLPATVIKAVSRNYQRPMHIFEGDIKSDTIQFYGIFTITGYDGILFMPFSTEADLRNSIVHIVVVELDDTPTQSQYIYTPKYEANARSN